MNFVSPVLCKKPCVIVLDCDVARYLRVAMIGGIIVYDQNVWMKLHRGISGMYFYLEGVYVIFVIVALDVV